MASDRFEILLLSLLENPEFIRWAQGELPEKTTHWNQWAASHTDGDVIMRHALEMVRAMRSEDERLTDDHIEKKVGEALRIARERESAEKGGSFFPIFLSGWNLAASVLIAIGLCFSGYRIYTNHARNSNRPTAGEMAHARPLKQITNTERALRYVQLPDGSSVVLHRNSTLKYPEAFTGPKREVYLAGEAFFEVTKDPLHPFYVYAGELTAKVHGTSFSVRAGTADPQITVAVKTGKVSVFRESNNPLLLTCNQQATFERARSRLTRTDAKSAVLLHIPIEDQVFKYAETPAAAVFDALGKAYGVTIDFDREVMAHCSITATLGDEPLDNKLKWLCTILEATYSITEDSITIKGNPCQ